MRLCDGPFRATHQILQLTFNPEMRRIIGDVGEYREEWASWMGIHKTLVDCAVEVRHEGHNQVRARFFPVPGKQANGCGVPGSNRELQDFHELDATQCPPTSEHPVVVIL